MMTGILQTGDIEHAIRVAEDCLSVGKHVIVARHEYPLPEKFFNENPFSLMFEHEEVEYEVWVDMMPEETKMITEIVKEKPVEKKPEYRCARCGALVSERTIVCKVCADEGPVETDSHRGGRLG